MCGGKNIPSEWGVEEDGSETVLWAVITLLHAEVVETTLGQGDISAKAFEEVRTLNVTAHQIAGAMGAPPRLQDLFHHATQGKTVSLDGFTPVTADECDEVIRLQAQLAAVRQAAGVGPAASEFGRLGGSVRSRAKTQAARANGRRGGRLRKTAAA